MTLGPDMGYTKEYDLDPASVQSASLLPIEKYDTVLDMCAAPGGKSLVLARQLAGFGKLVCNERSSTRRAHLHRVLDDHLPEEWRRIIDTTNHDATRWGLHEINLYDKILLDAPCSSERHSLHSSETLAEWSPSKTKRMAIQQYAMLCAALDAVRAGGLILYSTCSISSTEILDCIEKLLKKRAGMVEVQLIIVESGEPCKYGHQFWPDVTGTGPNYCCLLKKIDESNQVDYHLS
ncbi:Fmu (Sun) domain-containing protein [Thraustotheca clavata]|uniref:NOL1/NOP2/Sun domain family member 4 n=1 Tax=Thraustotheca clavata TaxID=74557 RepID=A0A1V9ZPX8_9STRA|nr:Fmu (Sun) domain-containing protein [Thraustotheca clavata]